MRMPIAVLLVPFLLLPALAPTGSSGICAGDPRSRACVGYTVLSTDCNVGAIAVNGVVLEGWFVIGEIYWSFCGQGHSMSGHSIEALAAGWYDQTYFGERSCGIYTALAGVPTDCAYGPPALPILV